MPRNPAVAQIAAHLLAASLQANDIIMNVRVAEKMSAVLLEKMCDFERRICWSTVICGISRWRQVRNIPLPENYRSIICRNNTDNGVC